jgi:prophage maintenance system killer protein
MQSIGVHLKEDYQYSKKFFGERELHNPNKEQISIDDMLRAHYLITDYFENDPYHKDLVSVYGLLNPTMLGSAYSRQFVQYDGIQKYQSDLEYCATTFFGLVKNHAFKDGNKRTALLCLLYHLYKRKRITKSVIKEYEDLTVNVAAGNYERYDYSKKYYGQDDYEVKMITHFLKKNTRTTDSTYRSITFQELKGSLKGLGINFSDPLHNFIDLYFEKRNIIGKTSRIKICTISFPGMKRQVNSETIRKIVKDYREKSGHEIDMNVIYQNSEPMYKMIQIFEGPFMRLKDK